MIDVCACGRFSQLRSEPSAMRVKRQDLDAVPLDYMPVSEDAEPGFFCYVQSFRHDAQELR